MLSEHETKSQRKNRRKKQVKFNFTKNNGNCVNQSENSVTLYGVESIRMKEVLNSTNNSMDLSPMEGRFDDSNSVSRQVEAECK